MTTLRRRWSFIFFGILAILSFLLLFLIEGSFWPENEQMQAFLTGGLLITTLLSVGILMILGWTATNGHETFKSQMDFMYKMTHELQTPVSSIRLSAEMLDSDAVKTSSERSQRYVRIIREESARMQWHIDKVLHIARAENQTLSLTLEKICLDELILSLLDRYPETVRAEVQTGYTLVYADRQHLINVVHNLIENAIKYTPEAPQIIISTTHEDNKIALSVRDNGIGIDPDHQKLIFDTFYRVPDNVANVKGFGLGLSYVQQIVRAHHWQLELTSATGVGSTFTLILPVAST
ncbi:sensor histidine kinase [Arundinibacter roseus]|uniref:histidine kinase n=1 Tax=Arundinibacter roseus TaxID=2070510 RepID=A0A4V6P8K3_9BACT|nr:HAMP domain-containing sensor histidine kinase [Arundinibacter roseus]TDB62305.1 HAMP domain-containing histidine kinase [Arundinibacter roseus]